MRILLVEDDEIIGKAVARSLEESHYEVKWLQAADAVESMMLSKEYAALIIDRTLPNHDTLDLIKALRQQGVDEPVLVLSARTAPEEIVEVLHSGADMCVSKPFTLSVLMANLFALLRRGGQAVAPVQPTLEQAGMKLDPNSYSVYIEGERISVSRREYSLLSKLLENLGEVVPREVLSQCIYGDEVEVESNAVEVHVHNLRKKLRANIIKTIRGVGYIVDVPRRVAKSTQGSMYALY